MRFQNHLNAQIDEERKNLKKKRKVKAKKIFLIYFYNIGNNVQFVLL